MKYTKHLSAAILVTLSLLLTSFTWAYWTSGALTPNPVDADHTVNVGVGTDVTTEIEAVVIKNNLKLVPEGRVQNENTETASIELEFNVTWKSDKTAANGTPGTLKIAHEQGKSDLDIDAFNISYDSEVEIVADSKDFTTVIVTVTLNEPKNKAAYDALKDQVLELAFTFNVEVQK